MVVDAGRHLLHSPDDIVVICYTTYIYLKFLATINDKQARIAISKYEMGELLSVICHWATGDIII